MDRKKTILIAAIVNAGLLVLLFITALHQEEESPKSPEMVHSVQEPGPLFNDSIVEAAKKETLAVMEELPLEPLKEPQDAIHQLPPLVAMQQPKLTQEKKVSEANVAQIPKEEPLRQIKIKKGDTLEKIAKQNRTSVDELVRINQLSSSFLRIGQVLQIPHARKNMTAQNKVQPRPLETPQKHLEYYTVKVGDNPWTIAMKHHLKVDELLKINNLNEERARRLKPGDRLRIR